MLQEVANGTIREIDGQERIYYEGYWIRHYNVPNNLAYKKRLIDQLTRRVFHHVEPGINTPGDKLEEVRRRYEAESNASRKRVLAAMLAGALLNRGADILSHAVELEQLGVTIKPENELLKECGLCFMGALEYGKYIRVKHGREGLEELWGEPFRAFSTPVARFLESRYIKIAHTMREIDELLDKINEVFARAPMFGRQVKLIEELAESGKNAMETLRSDPAIIEIWPCFVSAAERVADCRPAIPGNATRREHALGKRGIDIIHRCGTLMEDLANYRVPMPKTTQTLLEDCEQFRLRYAARLYRGF
ncbi:MAG: hypothetical protein OXD47_08675 [Gammaproteobacteria bacterium]|nr:hypothetical protein [Gammaproteobacteria bacterium]MCY4210612.1 hypothetical protein [Gammaproteobacteria bacterium]MCY4281399.1 hypothetical protein [Gammaproteobacteria bacterium]MCY4338857.1 hypothetical protein [Gammaproteobacteria bacterium]